MTSYYPLNHDRVYALCIDTNRYVGDFASMMFTYITGAKTNFENELLCKLRYRALQELMADFPEHFPPGAGDRNPCALFHDMRALLRERSPKYHDVMNTNEHLPNALGIFFYSAPRADTRNAVKSRAEKFTTLHNTTPKILRPEFPVGVKILGYRLLTITTSVRKKSI